MQIRVTDERLLLRVDRGEELVASILQVAEHHRLQSGLVHAIGALEDIELGFYVLDERRYLRRTLPEMHELVSLQGNLARLDGKAFLHAHVVLGARDFSTTGGHLFRGTVAVVAEVVLWPSREPVARGMDPPTGLNLWQL
jgi:predicted DNA-binding protein with PD1-like motif